MLVRALAVCVLALAAAAAHAAEEFTFDATEFQKKPLELGGYVELKQQHFTLNPDGALYLLNFYREPRSYLDDTTLTLKPSGVLRRGAVSLNFRAHLEGDWETRGFDRLARFDEFYGSYKPDPGFTLDAGKVSLKWGKGYAWNPVAFVERVKDPNDPDLAREGFTLLTADWIRNFDGALRTVAFTPVVLPASPDINPDFGAGRHLNAAAKLYLLYRDTDIDFMILSNGSRSRRYGADFSRNITSNLEIHGELARIEDTQRQVTTAAGQATLVRGAATSYLLGARHLSERDTTTVLEYYRNGPGLSEDEMKNFVRFVDSAYAQYLATGNDAALARAANLARNGYGRPNPGRDYLYLRVSQKEPFDILYFTPAITVMANAADHSTSVAPELLYTGFNNVELKLRAFFLNGGAGTEFGEKQNRRRIELQARLYF
ncbi:MAG: hypothetical protein A3I02_03115 [Betaproteobacteria bacterium RIFCSPLOWO2_02_FULL_67_26]|nr:MAG: hypothetical protein A3I02_03115 [Betaproteobacteria bacterium RIFCSPLOWO2_02_FULL_67_26]